MMRSVCDRIENIVGIEENAGYQHFRHFQQCFQKPVSVFRYKTGTDWKRVVQIISLVFFDEPTELFAVRKN